MWTILNTWISYKTIATYFKVSFSSSNNKVLQLAYSGYGNSWFTTVVPFGKFDTYVLGPNEGGFGWTNAAESLPFQRPALLFINLK